MNKFSWIEIEGIRYDGHDDYIACQTDVGFSSVIHGNKLEDLGISDKNGKEIGYLSVDFSDNTLIFYPCVSNCELADESIRIGHHEYVENVFLQDLTVVPAYDSILGDDSHGLLTDDYSDAGMVATCIPSLECVISPSDETLDSFFGASSGVEDNSYMDEAVSTSYSEDLVAIYLEHGIDDTLMPMFPESIDCTDLVIT